ncbi:MAG: AmmeMemoRadiSam system protein A [Thiohalocapsa sp.]
MLSRRRVGRRSDSEAAAFFDPRFEPVNDAELDPVHIEISVLTPPEPITFGNEEELLATLRPGVDGIILAENGAEGAGCGIFLPPVWAQLPHPRSFLSQLKRKAGISPDHRSGDVQAWRYWAESFGD